MLTFTDGDFFQVAAEVRINTVNCVGVMGAGVALAFKTKYPEMFRDYKEACQLRKVQPGYLHIWQSQLGEWIVNFPTKRHWRQPSQYEYIESGLKALRDFLISLGKVRVTLPALGCGHGGLDWERVSQMICDYLSDLDAEIIVFNPSSSREAGQKIKRQEYEADLAQLKAEGVVVVEPGDQDFPTTLRGISAATLWIKGNPIMLNRQLLAILPSDKPSEREVKATETCISAIAQPGVTFIVGYGSDLERTVIQISMKKGADVVILLAEGITKFRIRQDLQESWDRSRIAIVSATTPHERWNHSQASRSRELELTLARVALITDPSPRWCSKIIQTKARQSLPSIFYINYQNQTEIHNIFKDIKVCQISQKYQSSIPNILPILKCLGLPVELETELIESRQDLGDKNNGIKSLELKNNVDNQTIQTKNEQLKIEVFLDKHEFQQFDEKCISIGKSKEQVLIELIKQYESANRSLAEAQLSNDIKTSSTHASSQQITSSTSVNNVEFNSITSGVASESVPQDTASTQRSITLNSELALGLTQKALAERFNVSPSTVGRKKKKNADHFREWSCQNDPENLAWEYSVDSQLFYPVGDVQREKIILAIQDLESNHVTGKNPIPESHLTIEKEQLDNILAGELSIAALAKRLGVDVETVHQWQQKGTGIFAKWTAEQDPDGIPWQYSEKTDLFEQSF